jgi:caa(3)-type oxidase subunit IV
VDVHPFFYKEGLYQSAQGRSTRTLLALCRFGVDISVPGFVPLVSNIAPVIRRRFMSHDHSDAHGDVRKSYYKVFAMLILFTALTVGAAQIHFPQSMGQMGVLTNLAIGLLIACFKVVMVMYIFMHLKFDNKYLRAFVLVPLFLFAVMVFAFTTLEDFHHPF